MQDAFHSGVHGAGQLRRGFVEFLMLPVIITGAFCAAAIVVSVLDGGAGASPPRRLAEMILSPANATAFVTSVATSLMTVTSITFSVLLVAVQQTATSLSAVVFDQYLQRRSNQAYFGYFVGATAFCVIVQALARSEPAPVYGAIAALVLAVGSLVALLMLIHATVDQMRPERVVRSIHELALRAHDRELRLLAGTRQARRSPRGSQEREITASDNGYVVSVDVQALAAIARSVGADAEIIVDCELGAYVIYGETIARIAGVAASDDSHDEALLATFRFSDIRRTESDCGYSLDQLENIAWMAGTSAAQSPYTSKAAITSLRDLVARWTSSSSDRVRSPKDQDLLPVVYEDGATSRILHTFGTLLVAASESKQAHTAATIISCFAHVLPRLRLESDRIEFRRALDAALPTVVQQVGIPTLAAALNELVGALEVEGYDTGRVLRAQARLRTAMEEMASEPSSEQEMHVSD